MLYLKITYQLKRYGHPITSNAFKDTKMMTAVAFYVQYYLNIYELPYETKLFSLLLWTAYQQASRFPFTAQNSALNPINAIFVMAYFSS